MFQGIKAKDRERNPERLLQLKRICDMLLAAGYFRARVPILSPFDKVVGGLVWGITASNVDLDVDIIFQENSTIGERVRLSEQIVKALVKMKCPFPVQPQQIQGLDYPSLFPTTKWLVSRVYETRAETSNRMRHQAEFRFDQNVGVVASENHEKSDLYVGRVLSANTPVRKFKKQSGAKIDTLMASAEATLLEFGERFYNASTFGQDEGSQAGKDQGDNDTAETADDAALSNFQKMRRNLAKQQGATVKDTKGASAKSDAEAKAKAIEDEKRQEQLRSQMSEVTTSQGVSASGVGALILNNEAQIKDAMREYEEASSAASTAAPGGKMGLEQQFRRLEAGLMKQTNDLKARVQSMKSEYTAAKKALARSKEARAEQQTKLEKLKTALQELDEQEQKIGNQNLLLRLKELVGLNETLKRQESMFKENCLQQRAHLEQKLKALKSGADDEQTRRMLEIERLYEQDLSKYNKLRALLAKKNLQIARVQRQIDSIPTRAELLQYQRRFVELYELVSNKLVETRKYFSLYNMLEEKHRYMVNEVDLLNSIGKTVPKLMASSTGKDQLGRNFSSIISNMGTTQDQVYKRYQAEKAKCDVLSEKHKKLLQKQRKYFQAVKEFQEECYKNEKLTAAMDMYGGEGEVEGEG